MLHAYCAAKSPTDLRCNNRCGRCSSSCTPYCHSPHTAPAERNAAEANTSLFTALERQAERIQRRFQADPAVACCHALQAARWPLRQALRWHPSLQYLRVTGGTKVGQHRHMLLSPVPKGHRAMRIPATLLQYAVQSLINTQRMGLPGGMCS